MGSKRTSFFNTETKSVKKDPVSDTSGIGLPPDAASAASDKKTDVVTLFKGWLDNTEEGGGSGDSLVERRTRESREEKKFFRLILAVVGGMVLLFLLGFLITFVVSVKGREHTVVPDVTGKLLVEGMTELQERGLNTKVVAKYSDSPEDMGKILDQSPVAGLTVKAGRKVTVVVSRGTVIDKIADYKGKDINLVAMEIESLFVNYKPLIKIRKPIQYVYDDAAPGTILEQDISPGTPLTSLVEIQFVVSRGAEDIPIEIPNFMGLDYREAIKQLSLNNIPFLVKIQSDKETEVPEVVFQTPSPGDSVMPGSPVTITLSGPKKLAKNEIFGVFEYELPDYESYVDIKVVRVDEKGEMEPYFLMSHPGGKMAIPYLEKAETIFILYTFDQEIYRFQVVP